MVGVIKKYSPWIGFIGGIVGIGSTIITGVIAYQELTLKKPIDQRQAICDSYLGEIGSAKARGDKAKEASLRLEYEAYEANWRGAEKLSEIVPSLINSPLAQIPAGQKEEVKNLITNLDGTKLPSILSKGTVGDAWFIAGDFEKARENYQAAISENVSDPKFYAAHARADAYILNAGAEPEKQEKLLSEIKLNIDQVDNLDGVSNFDSPSLRDPILQRTLNSLKNPPSDDSK